MVVGRGGRCCSKKAPSSSEADLVAGLFDHLLLASHLPSVRSRVSPFASTFLHTVHTLGRQQPASHGGSQLPAPYIWSETDDDHPRQSSNGEAIEERGLPLLEARRLHGGSGLAVATDADVASDGKGVRKDDIDVLSCVTYDAFSLPNEPRLRLVEAGLEMVGPFDLDVGRAGSRLLVKGRARPFLRFAHHPSRAHFQKCRPLQRRLRTLCIEPKTNRTVKKTH